MSDPDDVPIPRDVVEMRGAPYWLRVARANLGPRRAKPTADRPSLRESLHEMASFDDLHPEYGPKEPL